MILVKVKWISYSYHDFYSIKMPLKVWKMSQVIRTPPQTQADEIDPSSAGGKIKVRFLSSSMIECLATICAS